MGRKVGGHSLASGAASTSRWPHPTPWLPHALARALQLPEFDGLILSVGCGWALFWERAGCSASHAP